MVCLYIVLTAHLVSGFLAVIRAPSLSTCFKSDCIWPSYIKTHNESAKAAKTIIICH